MRISAADLAKYKAAFYRFDEDHSGSIDVWELRGVLRALGQNPTHEELIAIMEEADEDDSGTIELDEFIKFIIKLKGKYAAPDDEDTIMAFTALGGNHDRTGHVKTKLLEKRVKDLGLTINIHELLGRYDKDMTGFLDYEDFFGLIKEDGEEFIP